MIGRYLRNVLFVTDEEINVMTGGAVNHTISLRAAYARQRGHGYKRLLGRAMCAFLAAVCRCDHCGQVIRDAETGGRA